MKRLQGPTPWDHFKTYLIAGILALLPIFILYLILKYIFDLFNNSLFKIMPLVVTGCSNTVNATTQCTPSSGAVFVNYLIYIIALILIILIFGALTVWLFATKWKEKIDKTAARIPIFGAIFNPFKQITETFLAKKKAKYKRVVLLEYPRRGLWAIGFVTKDHVRISGKDMIAVVVPSTPVPMSGYVVFCHHKEIVEIDISVEDALGVVVSGGIFKATEMARKKARKKRRKKHKVKRKK